MSQMGVLLCKCCCPCKSNYNNNSNSVGVLPEKHLKVLLLGLNESGKTEVAHMLTKSQRSDYEPTNGSKYYQLQLPTEINGSILSSQSLGITEIGGSQDMQRIWHHYFAGTMAIIYCYDMSSSYEHLSMSFQLLDKVLSNRFVRGKPVLLVGTKSDLADEGLQLYDIENSFQLASMANNYACKFKMCYSGIYDEEKHCTQSLIVGIHWLMKTININYEELKVRIKGDKNLQAWQEQTEKLIAVGKMKRWSYRRFPGKRSKKQRPRILWKYASQRVTDANNRPRTAPAIFTILHSSLCSEITLQTSVDTIKTTMTVPIDVNVDEDDNKGDVIKATTGSKHITDV